MNISYYFNGECLINVESDIIPEKDDQIVFNNIDEFSNTLFLVLKKVFIYNISNLKEIEIYLGFYKKEI